MRRPSPAPSLLTVALLILSSCVTVPQLRLGPIEAGAPVSASGYYLDRDGKTVEPSEYEVLRHFKLEKTVTASVAAAAPKEVSIDLESDLEAIIREADGEAVVNLIVVPVSVNNADTDATVGGTGFLGPAFTALGAAFLITGVALQSTDFDSPAPIIIGSSFLGAGISMDIHAIIVSTVGKQVWKFAIEGDVAKRL